MLGFSAMFRYLLSLTLLATISYGQEKPAEPPQQPASAQPNPPANPAPPPKLQVRKSVRASYPLEAEEKGIQGQVIVRVLISEAGDVETAEVVSGEKELTRSALEAVKKWKFEPYLINGKAIKVRTNIPFDFYFSGNAKDVKDDPPASTDPVAAEKADSTDKPLPPRVRVASGVVAGLRLHTVQPIYPPEAKAGRVQGRVILHAIIDKDGRIKSLTVVSGPKELIQAASGAVEQWTYRPYLLEGKPIEVDTTIEVNFALSWR